MNNDALQQLLNSPVSFLASAAQDGNIAISSRIRLARNLKNFPFSTTAKPEHLSDICELVTAAAADASTLPPEECLTFDIADMSPNDRGILEERGLANKEFLSGSAHSRLIARSDGSCSVMINGEDHLRIRCLAPGFQLDKVWQTIDRLDNELAAHLEYAFDDQLGFLTCSPTDAGTGLKASVMLHLPGLIMTGKLAPTIHGVTKLNLEFKSFFGDGTEYHGNLFQISNQVTLGDTENGIIEKLSQVVRQLIAHELAARQLIIEKDQAALLDHVGRSYGILRHGYKISLKEALNCLSGIRLGVDMGLFSHVDMSKVNEMFLTIHSAHLQKNAGKTLSAAEKDIFRASYCRKELKKPEKNN